ncbi:ABC transporter ATP-binding protein [Propionispira raffinosivorans]|uniref:ABC transporter ATP-binding protein n=1 Tax=Propionispira raffinosivorans TaxID=86959 RepID=UPI00038081A7|nr:ABC transporter ATP-binding protein [Propionispira raffinosivorans]
MNIDIAFTNIHKTFPSLSLYQGLTGKISAGVCTCIVGKNGSGKSTLLKILSGIIKPSAGVVAYMDAKRKLAMEDFRHHAGFLTPDMQFYDMMTAKENLYFFAAMSGIELSDSELVELLAYVQLAGTLGAIKNFSTGMKQRLKIALLVASKKEVWFLDEPSSNLDEAGRALVKKILFNARSQNRTILLATNDSVEVGYADDVIRLS